MTEEKRVELIEYDEWRVRRAIADLIESAGPAYALQRAKDIIGQLEEARP